MAQTRQMPKTAHGPLPSKSAKRHSPGRPPLKPSPDDAEAVARLCDLIISGMSMGQACARNDCPSKTAVYARMAADDAFRTTIARAREAQQHAMIDDTIDLADGATPDNWQVVKLRIWARQWRAAKLAPKVYGTLAEPANAVEANPLALLVQQIQGRALMPVRDDVD
ncbi:hypothetical protein [Roseomonas sp. 18066]|uniref:terminase small subunit-like protein n=1 Tax=Roseomonas sp. 18066 TaxID=2681412 RepID=UPI00135BC9CE|nr:hypothetical protein [Roseomonas sp. 18066]